MEKEITEGTTADNGLPEQNADPLGSSAATGCGAWFKTETRMPDYYETVWAYDGSTVFLAKVVGRSYTPQRKIWRNLEANGVDDVWNVELWQPCYKPPAP